MKLGILGGSFDPPHFGHILLASWAITGFDLDKLLVIPCYKHPFGKKLTSFNHRFKMCELAFKRFRGLVSVSDIEKKMGGVSKTITTLKKLSSKYKNDKLFLVIGSDILKELNTWYKIQEIKKNYEIIVVPRGKKSEGLYIPDIKSRNIRKKIDRIDLIAKITTKSVASYIKRHSLYD